MRNQRGQSLLELLIAMGIFVLVVSAVTFLILDVYLADRAGRERMLATFLAQEGIEAVRSIRDGDFDNLSSGIYGLALSGNKWIFSGSYDDHNQFRRQIIISDVMAEIDQTDIKKIESQVTWQITPLRQVSAVLTDYLTDWEQTQGNAGELNVDISEADLGGHNNKELKKIKIENIAVSNITIDKITVWWNNSNLIEEIKIDGERVWKHNDEGFPDGRQPSGTELDIENFTIETGEGQLEIDKFKFDDNMTGASFIIKFVMTDNSTKYVLVEPGVAPPPPLCGIQANTFVVDTSEAEIGGKGDKELRGVTVENTDSNCAITIDKITVTWNNDNLIEEIKIDGTKVWSKKSPGSPAGKQPSGTELDIQDFILSASSGALNIDKFKFDGDMTGATFDVTFTMGDGSMKLTGSFSL